ncbi:XdhC/CoxI family protein [Flavobacterium sp.]|uniref:XdhC family protein n=1 Tax=Flavobacterium sp. TaxID=239 RepID=UPI002620F939|nr:XdhC/CoxI family protein [Flavobacterium sp.]
MVLDFYKSVRELLQQEQRLILMVVIANEGSSPGRKGFKMAVSKKRMFGTIGGGIMEHKLVEYAQNLLTKAAFRPFIKHQIHDKSAPIDQSGMICSGQQTIAFYDLNTEHIPIIDSIVSKKNHHIRYTEKGFNTDLHPTAQHEWEFVESVALPNRVYIVGGGHVGLALSEVLSRLDFEIYMLDHRENLNTMEANTFAHFRKTIEFEHIDHEIPEGNNIYVVIMSFGYRTDEIIIRRLLHRRFKYIGMMGSKEKIATLYTHLLADGFTQEQLDKVYSPIGIDIKSESAQEIAISVAAQLISVKNKTS